MRTKKELRRTRKSIVIGCILGVLLFFFELGRKYICNKVEGRPSNVENLFGKESLIYNIVHNPLNPHPTIFPLILLIMIILHSWIPVERIWFTLLTSLSALICAIINYQDTLTFISCVFICIVFLYSVIDSLLNTKKTEN